MASFYIVGCNDGIAGKVGFGRDLGATRSLTEGDGPGQAMAATSAALVEAELTLLDPLRRYKIWRKASFQFCDHVTDDAI